MSDKFNKTIKKNVLPQNLTYLELGGKGDEEFYFEGFNKPINIGILPNSLKEIIIKRDSQKLLILDDKFKNIVKLYFYQ